MQLLYDDENTVLPEVLDLHGGDSLDIALEEEIKIQTEANERAAEEKTVEWRRHRGGRMLIFHSGIHIRFPFGEYSDVVSVTKEKKYGSLEYGPAEVNWSAMGSQNVEVTQEFIDLMQHALWDAKLLDFNLSRALEILSERYPTTDYTVKFDDKDDGVDFSK